MINESLPIMTQTIANQSNLYNNYRNPNTTTKLTLEQQYADTMNRMIPNQQQFQSDPYSDFKNTINSCSDIVKEKILQDPRFQNIYATCEEVLKQVLYAKVIPEVLSDQNGRIIFEQLHSTTKAIKEEIVQKDIQKERQLELLMQDEVVLRRLQELQNASQAPQQPQPTHPTQTTTLPSQQPLHASQPSQNTSQSGGDAE